MRGSLGIHSGATDARCADVTSEPLEGSDKGKAVTVPITAAIYSSGVKVGQVIKLVRVPPPETSRPSTSSRLPAEYPTAGHGVDLRSCRDCGRAGAASPH